MEFGDHGERGDDEQPDVSAAEEPGAIEPSDEVDALLDDLDELEPLTLGEEATLERREPVEDALLLAEATASGAGEPVLAACLSRIQLLWDLGQEGHALRLLDKARNAVIAALKDAGLDGEEEEGAR